ncbi:MAG: Smr/MutS family protein [Rikenellaceae bacterium]
MDVKIGDTIRFLNDVGGGVIVDIQIDRGEAIVKQEDGFSFPTPLAECVVVDRPQQIEVKPEVVVVKLPKVTRKEPKVDDISKSIKRLQEVMSSRNTSIIAKQTTSKSRKVKAVPQLIEVDLHIDKLLDSTAGMSNSDILEYQLDVLRQTINEHAQYRGQKIVFIHGKGDGVLRCAIERELKRLGRINKTQYASFKRYGFGALIVVM